jgi:molecular chaperone GrpE (heat shock protein)
MNDFNPSDVPREFPPEPPRELRRERIAPVVPLMEELTQGTSSLYRLFEAFIALREKNERQHKLFEQTLAKSRDAIQASFNSFAADTQRAYQQLRQEMHGEKRIGLVLMNEMMELGLDLEQIVAARPQAVLSGAEGEAVARWMDAVEVESRKVNAALIRHGVHRYDAPVGTPYDPKWHERVGSKRVDGLEALRVAEQVQHGFASQLPGFVLRRPKVIVTE